MVQINKFLVEKKPTFKKEKEIFRPHKCLVEPFNPENITSIGLEILVGKRW